MVKSPPRSKGPVLRLLKENVPSISVVNELLNPSLEPIATSDHVFFRQKFRRTGAKEVRAKVK